MSDVPPDDKTPGQTILDKIKELVAQEGIETGTKEYAKRQRQLHVITCRQMRGYTSCQECPYNDACDLYIQVKRDYLDK